MQTKIEFVLTAAEARELVPGYSHEKDQDAQLVSLLVEQLGWNSELGGWLCRSTKTSGGGVKVTGKLIPPGGAVLA